MKKCPLLKITNVEIIGGRNEQAVEYFQDCIGELCMAWDDKNTMCEYFTLNREVQVYR